MRGAGGGQVDDAPATAAPALRVRLFGELDLRLGERQLPPLESGRLRSLLAYLVLHGEGPLPRQHLAFLLWPDSGEGQARTNLRHLLHTLRRAHPELDAFVAVTPQSLRWRRESPQWVDVDAFRAALARGRAAALPDAALVAYGEAAELHAGDLLEGCYDEWLVAPREQLRDECMHALRESARLLAGSGRLGEAIARQRELVRRDPLREDAYRVLMRLHDAAGDRSGAVRAYHECVSILERELAVAPSAETEAVYAALVRPPGTQPPPPRLGSSALVGRRRELRLLTERWREAGRGNARFVLVTGEAGVGKSRLVEELAARCEHEGALVAQARSYRSEGELGFGVATAWLRALHGGGHLRRVPKGHLAELARLLPEVGAPPTPAGVPHGEAEQRRRLFDAFAAAVAPPGRPVLLVADDAHWCDVHTLQLLHHLVRPGAGAPLLAVATARREDMDDGHQLLSLVASLTAAGVAVEIPLGRLDRAETGQLLRALGAPLDVDRVHASTEGNPLFIVETVRAGRQPGGDGRPPLTPKLQAVVAARLAALSPAARQLCAVAATAGRAFTTELLAAASAMPDHELGRALDELWRRGVIREQGVDAYDFTHGTIREVAYALLPPPQRRRVHVRVAEALPHVHAQDPDAVSGQVAHHYDSGGRVEPAVVWYQRAAVQSLRLHAAPEAVRLLWRARQLVAALPAGERRRQHELAVLAALAVPLAVVEGFASDRLAETQRRAVALAALDGSDPDPPVLRSLALSHLCRHDFAAARATAERLRGLACRIADDVLLVESHYLSGVAEFWDGRFEAALGHFEDAGDGFRPAQRGEHLVRFGHDPGLVCLSRRANTLAFLGRTDEAVRARDAALVQAAELPHAYTRGVVHVFAAVLCVDLGDTEHLATHVHELRSAFEDHPWHRVTSDAFRGYADVLAGRPEEGIGRLRAALGAIAPVDQSPGQRALVRRLLAAASGIAGDATDGVAAVEEALLPGGTRIWEAELRRVRAELLARGGAPPDDVEAELRRAQDVASSQGALLWARRVERSRARLRAGT